MQGNSTRQKQVFRKEGKAPERTNVQTCSLNKRSHTALLSDRYKSNEHTTVLVAVVIPHEGGFGVLRMCDTVAQFVMKVHGQAS